jgi:deoxyribonuclease-4
VTYVPEFVHSVHVSKEKAPLVKKTALDLGLSITCHGSYYINLNAVEDEKREASIQRVISAAKRTEESGGYSMTFHPAFYLKNTPKETLANVKKQLMRITSELKNDGYKINVRPETTGKGTQFGSLDELLELSSQRTYSQHFRARNAFALNYFT